MPLLNLLFTALPAIFSLVRTAEAIPQAHPDVIPAGDGQGTAKLDLVTTVLRAVLGEFPALSGKVDAIVAISKSVISIYVLLSNAFGWSPKVALIAQELSATQAPAPLEDVSPVAVTG